MTMRIVRGDGEASGRRDGRIRSAARALGWGGAIAMTLQGPFAQEQVAQFRSTVDVTSVDVAVVDDEGRPILDLTPGDFTVRIDGVERRVVSADWVPFTGGGAAAVEPPPEGYSSNEHAATGGRLLLIVVDQPNIRNGGTLGIGAAVNAFIDRLDPADRIAAVGIGPGTAATPFTSDRERVKVAVSRMTGQRQATSNQFSIAISEALAIRRGDSDALERMLQRECGEPPLGQRRPDDAMRIQTCRTLAQAEARLMAADGTAAGEQTLAAMRALLGGLRAIEVPKTIVLVTEGFVLEDQLPSFVDIERLAGVARTSIYVLRLDDQVFDVTEQSMPPMGARLQDRAERAQGIERLAAATRGSVFNVIASADAAFARIESELSGYYLLGVESDPVDRAGPLPIRVSVGRRGATIRSRRELVAPSDEREPQSPRQAVAAGLASPLLLPALPLRVATFALQGPEPSRVQLLIHADIGGGQTAARPIALAYTIHDREGRLVERQQMVARLQPVMLGVPSPLQFIGGASVTPGEYTLKFAAADGETVGTVEHALRAELGDAGEVTLSDLMVGGPSDDTPLLRPTVGHSASFGFLHAYLESYGPNSDSVGVTYEVAAGADSPAIYEAAVSPHPAGDDRTIFSHVMPIRQLPPGRYVLRAVVSSGLGGEIDTLTRSFAVAPPAVLMTSAEGAASPTTAPSEVYLPVPDRFFVRPLVLEEVSSPETLGVFRARVAPAAVAAFDRGAAALASGDYAGAESAFKDVVNAEADNTAPGLAYLAATFAASGHDVEAAGAWQTSLIDGSDLPDIYRWLGDALIRMRDLGQARTVLEEAAAAWPSDVRFAQPLAMLYAMLGQGREAVRTLERYVAAHPEDHEALQMVVGWIYQLHQAGAVAQSAQADRERARIYAEAYRQAGGAQVALVEQWMDALEGRQQQR
jgi:VWFA-related protein